MNKEVKNMNSDPKYTDEEIKKLWDDYTKAYEEAHKDDDTPLSPEDEERVERIWKELEDKKS
jgi:hypothetical protein